MDLNVVKPLHILSSYWQRDSLVCELLCWMIKLDFFILEFDGIFKY